MKTETRWHRNLGAYILDKIIQKIFGYYSSHHENLQLADIFQTSLFFPRLCLFGMLASKKRGYDRMAAAAGLKYEQKSPSAPGDREEDEKEEKKRLVSFSVVQPSAVVHIEAPDEPPASVFRLLEQKKQQKCLNSQDAVGKHFFCSYAFAHYLRFLV